MADSVFTIFADQWGEYGFIYRDGMIFQYDEDRKEQRYREQISVPLESFLARSDLTDEVRNWAHECLRMKD